MKTFIIKLILTSIIFTFGTSHAENPRISSECEDPSCEESVNGFSCKPAKCRVRIGDDGFLMNKISKMTVYRGEYEKGFRYFENKQTCMAAQLERQGISDSAGKGNPKGCCYPWADLGQAITRISLRRNEPKMTVVVKRKYDDSSANQICLEGKSPKEREAQEKLLVQKKERECAKNHEFVPGGFTLKGLSVGMSRYQVEEQLESRGFQCEVDLGGSIIVSLIGKLSKVCTKEKKENSSGFNLLHSVSNLIQFTFDNDETGCAQKLSAISFGSGILNLGNMTVREVAQALVDSGKVDSMQYVASEDGFCSERGDKGDRICVTMASGIVFTKIDGANFNKGGPSFD